MQKVILIDVDQKVDAEGIIHFVPRRDLIKHKLVGCTCGCFRQYIELPEGMDMRDYTDDYAEPGMLEDFEPELPYAIVHKSKDGREHLVEIITQPFKQAIESRRKYVAHIENLTNELSLPLNVKQTYLTKMNCVFNDRWNTN